MAEFHKARDGNEQSVGGHSTRLQNRANMPVVTTKTLDDAKLVAAIVTERDTAAFAILFERYSAKLNGYVLRLGLESGQAEEIVQDVMLTLWRKGHLFDATKSSLGTWLFRIARNRRIDILRRNKVDYVDPSSSLFDAVDLALGADSAMDLDQKQTRLRAVLTTLPQDQASLIQLSFFDNLSHGQIAAKTGLPLGTIKSRLRLAFSRLRQALQEAGITNL